MKYVFKNSLISYNLHTNLHLYANGLFTAMSKDLTYVYLLLIVQGMLRCGQSNVYIKPECVCSFHNVYEATFYHSYSSCPEGTPSDKVTQLKCKSSLLL